MSHTFFEGKKRLINRVRRISGQVEAISKLLQEEGDCSRILQTIAACKGALDGLMAEVIEGHIRFHVVNPDVNPNSERSRSARTLIQVIKSYLC